MYEYQEPGSLGLVGSQDHSPALQGPTSGHTASQELDPRQAEIHAQGMREGMLQAQQMLEKELAGERAKIAEAVRTFERQTSEYYGRVEAELVHLALSIAAKILHREAQVDRMLVAALVKVALEKLQQNTQVTVHVRPEEVVPWTEYFQKNMAGRIRVDVKPDLSLEPHSCVLETELGETELGLDAQLKEVEQGFFDLLAQRPEAK
jgi:flagellar assembly protein FliH